ncbi:hypothetical protein Aduo_003102 [Ancylostoma duodenale]
MILRTDPIDGVHAVGHNKCYEHFLVPYYDGLMGSWVRVRIVEVAKFHMRSESCKKSSEEGKANGAVLTDWTAKKLDDCKPIGTFKAGEMISTPAPIEKSPIAVIVLSVPLVIGMILWYFIGI